MLPVLPNGFVDMVSSHFICPLVYNRFSFHSLLSQEISMFYLFNLNIFIKPDSVLASLSSYSANSYWRMNFDNITKCFFEELPVNKGSSDTHVLNIFIRICLEVNRIVTFKVSSFNNFR